MSKNSRIKNLTADNLPPVPSGQFLKVREFNGLRFSMKEIRVSKVRNSISRFLQAESSDLVALSNSINIWEPSILASWIEFVSNGKLEDLKLDVSRVNERNMQFRRSCNENHHEYRIRLKSSEYSSHIQIPLKIYQFERLFNWKDASKYLIPESMNISLYRFLQKQNWKEAALRVKHGRSKRLQIQVLSSIVEKLLECGPCASKVESGTWIDFCGGRGDLGLFLAHQFPEINMTTCDLRAISLEQAQYRADQLGLQGGKYSTQVADMLRDVTQLHPSNNATSCSIAERDFAVGLHCCGRLTDKALDHFATGLVRKAIIIVPCCFSKHSPIHPSELCWAADDLNYDAITAINRKRLSHVLEKRPGSKGVLMTVDPKIFGSKMCQIIVCVDSSFSHVLDRFEPLA